MKVLAIDIGGTKSAMGLCDLDAHMVTNVTGLTTFVSKDYRSVLDMISDWQSQFPGWNVSAVGAGVAGPVINGSVHLTNLGWDINAAEISAAIKKPFKLCNDMESHGWGILGLTEDSVTVLNKGIHGPGAKALIAAGTGLGESIIGWDGKKNIPMAGEGGHSSFSPTTPLEDELLRFLRGELQGHVSWERILGGLDGFRHLARFLAAQRGEKLPDYLSELPDHQLDWGRAIVTAGEKDDGFATEVLTLYALLYGKEAANLALKCVPRGGVYIGGGIAPRIMPWLINHFMDGFTDKGRFAGLLSNIPVYVIQDNLNGLKGAAIQFAR